MVQVYIVLRRKRRRRRMGAKRDIGERTGSLKERF